MSKPALPCTGNQEWNTPVRIIEAARRAMGGIDCDPATAWAFGLRDAVQARVEAGMEGVVGAYREKEVTHENHE